MARRTTKVPPGNINCFEAHEDGSITIYLELFGDDEKNFHVGDDGCFQIAVAPHDVRRFMVSGIDALSGERSRR